MKEITVKKLLFTLAALAIVAFTSPRANAQVYSWTPYLGGDAGGLGSGIYSFQTGTWYQDANGRVFIDFSLRVSIASLSGFAGNLIVEPLDGVPWPTAESGNGHGGGGWTRIVSGLTPPTGYSQFELNISPGSTLIQVSVTGPGQLNTPLPVSAITGSVPPASGVAASSVILAGHLEYWPET